MRRKLPCACSFSEAGAAAEEIVGNCFPRGAKDFALWAWYCRHFDRRRIVEFAALDYERDRRREKNRVDAALRRLGKKDRAFARAVLRGESWREMGLAKSTFSDRMKKVEKLLSRP